MCKAWRRKRCGFSLIELLVVITIILILAGMVISAAFSARQTALRVKCAANLNAIYQAYSARKKTEPQEPMVDVLRAEGWAGVLLGYMNGNVKPFKCPTDKTPHFGGVNCTGYQINRTTYRCSIQFVPGAYGIHRSGAAWPPWNAATEFAGIRLSDTNATYQAWVRISAGTPGTNTTWRIQTNQEEGSQGSRQTAEVEFDTTVKPATIRMTQGGTAGGNGSPSLILQDGAGKNFKDPVAFMQIGELYSIGTVDNCSYGMTDYDLWMTFENRILFMDYDASMISTQTNQWDAAPSFARHRGEMNCLFANGSIQLLDPADIDPNGTNTEALVTYWEPAPEP